MKLEQFGIQISEVARLIMMGESLCRKIFHSTPFFYSLRKELFSKDSAL